MGRVYQAAASANKKTNATGQGRREVWIGFAVVATLAKSVGISRLSDVPHALGERGYGPVLEVCGDDDVFQHKLRSIEAYRSQLPIASLVDSIRQDGPYESLRDVHFRLYSSKKYRPLFAD